MKHLQFTFAGVSLIALAASLPSVLGAGDLKFRHHAIANELPTDARGGGDYGLTALVDLDRDGDLDFVLGGRLVPPARLYWFEFQSSERWVQHTVGTDYRSDVGIAPLDVDGDGWKDLVASGVWYRNQTRPRSAEFERAVFDADAGGAHDILAHDIDGDGRLDVVLMGDEKTQLKDVRWYATSAERGAPWKHRTIGPPIHGAITPGAILDVDGDKDPDVLRGDAWFENADSHGGRWVEHADVPFGRVGPFGKCVRCAAADLDGDGKPEIVISDADIVDSHVAILRRTGGDSPRWSRDELPRSFTYGSLHSLAVADLDLDGRLDVAVNEQEELLPPGRSNPRWIVWQNLGKDGFAERVILDAKLGGHELQAGDVDADGDVDLCSKPWGVRGDNGAGGKMHVDFLENLIKP